MLPDPFQARITTCSYILMIDKHWWKDIAQCIQYRLSGLLHLSSTASRSRLPCIAHPLYKGGLEYDALEEQHSLE